MKTGKKKGNATLNDPGDNPLNLWVIKMPRFHGLITNDYSSEATKGGPPPSFLSRARTRTMKK